MHCEQYCLAFPAFLAAAAPAALPFALSTLPLPVRLLHASKRGVGPAEHRRARRRRAATGRCNARSLVGRDGPVHVSLPQVRNVQRECVIRPSARA